MREFVLQTKLEPPFGNHCLQTLEPGCLQILCRSALSCSCALLRSFADSRLRSFALICAFLRPTAFRTWVPEMGTKALRGYRASNRGFKGSIKTSEALRGL